MCRFLLFKGRDPILVADLLTRPAHSIINQSYDCRLRIDQRRPLNGDGFGVGWFTTSSTNNEVGGKSTTTIPTTTTNQTATCTSTTSQQDRQRAAAMAAKSPVLAKRLSVTQQPSQLFSEIQVTVVDGQATTVITDDNQAKECAEQSALATLSEDDICASNTNYSNVNGDTEEPFDLFKTYTDPQGPCVFTSILPAWNNLNLIRLSEKITSRLVFAHVRAASPGFPIAETNCHPWCYGRFLWMHNGYIGGFNKIKRRLQRHLRDSLYHYVQGNTDSEWSFALYLNQFPDPLHGRYSADEMRQALLQTIALLNSWLKEAGIREISLLNFAVSDGDVVICSRYINSRTSEPASLFYSSGTRFERVDSAGSGEEEGGGSGSGGSGVYRMVKSSNKREDIIVVSSEPLTYERADWIPVPANTVVVLTSRFNVLIYPIIDEYYSADIARRTTPTLNAISDGSVGISDSDNDITVQTVWG